MSCYRIATLLPSATELVSDLGMVDSIVCVSHECDWPEEIYGLPKATSCNIPDFGDQKLIDQFVKNSVKNGRPIYDVNVDMLRNLNVSHIVTQGVCDVCAVSPDLIEASLRGNQCLISSQTKIISLCGTSINGIFKDIISLSELFNRKESMRLILKNAKRKLESLTIPSFKDMTVLMLEWIDPPYIGGHWVPEQIEAAGFKCAMGQAGEKSKMVSWDEIIKINPDFIGVIACGADLKKNQEYVEILYKMSILEDLKAVKMNNIFAFDANKFFSRPTLRVIDGIEILQKKFLDKN